MLYTSTPPYHLSTLTFLNIQSGSNTKTVTRNRWIKTRLSASAEKCQQKSNRSPWIIKGHVIYLADRIHSRESVKGGY